MDPKKCFYYFEGNCRLYNTGLVKCYTLLNYLFTAGDKNDFNSSACICYEKIKICMKINK